MDRAWFLANLWRWKCGVPELTLTDRRCSYEQAREQWCPEFIQLMRNRMILGSYRYGTYKTSRVPYDRIGSAIARLKRYQQSGNLEYLVDAANLQMIEYEVGTHPNKHFHSVDDGQHVEVLGK